MLALRVNLVAGARHERFAVGTSVAALTFVRAETIDEAENIAARELEGLGWARMETERCKQITNYAQYQGKETLVAQAFRNAEESGFGYIIYPEVGT